MAVGDAGGGGEVELLGGGGEGDYFLGVTFGLGVVVGHVLDGDASEGGVLELAHDGREGGGWWRVVEGGR